MASPDLTTVQKVKDYLRKQDMSEQSEIILQDFIVIASRMVRAATKRRFTAPRETNVIREFRTYGNHEVYVDEVLSPSDITSVTDESGMSVSYDADFEEEKGPARGCTIELSPWLSDGYGGIQGLPEDHADMFITEWRPRTSGPVYPRKIFVRGNFGYNEDFATPGNPLGLPSDIEFATRRAVALWFKEEIAHYTDDAFISRGRQFDPEELPPLSMATLKGGDWIVRDTVLV